MRNAAESLPPQHMPSVRPRSSAAVLLTRGVGADLEVYLVLRSPKLKFFGGYWACPGGALDEVDRRPGDEDLEGALERCALRELFEETGILPAPLAAAIPSAIRGSLRESLLDRTTDAEAWRPFADAVEAARSHLRRITAITTPPLGLIRHYTPYLHIELPDGEEPEILRGELIEGRFIGIATVLDEWRRGGITIVPPVMFLLEILARRGLEAFYEEAARTGERIAQGQLHRSVFTPGALVAPLRTPTLPPAETTNTILVGGERVFVIDPATPEVSEQERLFETMDRWLRDGRRFEGVLLTHHHHDHVGAVRVTAERYGLPVHAHPETLSRLELSGLETRTVEDRHEFDLGLAPDGSPDWRMIAHHTPGHAPGHLVFIESRYRAAFVGDLVSTLSTIVIDPPEGHMATYIASLERIREERIEFLYPSHGPIHREGQRTLDYHLKRRADREGKLLAALEAGPATPAQLLPIVYDDAAPEVMPYAERSMIAGLEKLAEEGRALERDGCWRLANPN